MTMLDDDRLASLLARAGATFDVPASGPDDILARAAGRPPVAGDAGDDAGGEGDGEEDGGALDGTADLDPARESRVGRIAAVGRRHRVLSVAACILVVLVLAGAVGALTRGPSHPTLSSSLLPTSRALPGGVPTTTSVPPGFSATHAPTAASGDAKGSVAGPAVTVPTTAPPLPSGAVGQPAKIEQTGSLGLTVRPRRAGADRHAADQPRRGVRRLRGQLADPDRRGDRRPTVGQRDAPGARGQLRRRC